MTTTPLFDADRLGQSRRSVAVVVLLLVWMLLSQLQAIVETRGGLTVHGDAYSEANAIRAGQHYAEFGFFVDAGLPHIVHGERFAGVGWVADLDRYPLPRGVYTRYPPLPDMLCGLYERWFGFDQLMVWRLVPVLFGICLTMISVVLLWSALGAVASVSLIVASSVVPMATTHLHGLHFQGYAHALFLLLLSLLVRSLARNGPLGAGTMVGALVIGLMHGGLSYEYFFVLAGAPFAVWLALSDSTNTGAVRKAAVLSALLIASFALAHALHFLQVAVFYGSMESAFADLAGRARFRQVGLDPRPHFVQVIDYTTRYLSALLFDAHNKHFGPLLFVTTSGAAVGALVRRRHAGSAGGSAPTVEPDDRGARRGLVAVLVAFAFAFSWIAVMPSHAGIHTHIVPRVFFLPYFVGVLVIIRQLRLTDTHGWERPIHAPAHDAMPGNENSPTI